MRRKTYAAIKNRANLWSAREEIRLNYYSFANIGLLKHEKVAFLSSRKVPPEAVMLCYDWTAKVREAGICVIGGFQSALERDVLKLLLKDDGGPVVMVLARKMWRIIPGELREPIASGRFLVVSPVGTSVNRVSRESALIRNRFILENSKSVIFASVDPYGSLDRLAKTFPHLPQCVFADVRANPGCYASDDTL